MAIIEQANLFYQKGSSDKEYNIYIDEEYYEEDDDDDEDYYEEETLYTVYCTYGRRGSAAHTTYKARDVEYDEAWDIFQKVLNQKLSKGYLTSKAKATKKAADVIKKKVKLAKIEMVNL